jgi:hypothetical protein
MSTACEDSSDFSIVDDTTWALRGLDRSDSSPSLTPSGGSTSQSSHASDISQTERLRINLETGPPFGTGETAVPEALQTLGVGESIEDMTLANSGEGSKQKVDVKIYVELEYRCQ